MDAYLAIVSRRDEREFDGRPVDAAAARRILDAGRMAGSARNNQPWRFVVVEDRDVRSQLAVCAYSPGLVVSAPLVIVVAAATAGTRLSGFDAGRAAQNVMLAAWAEGLASCPAGLADPGRAAALLGLGEGEPPVIALCVGHPRRRRDPSRLPAEEWVRRARRRPFEQVVRWVGGTR